ncbi:hypothetical protein ACCI51_10995 [Microbulbifer echini]|uniref:Uncharacterized protein n=1 Tax=Microbulbifer echini TaxID=1529067 RepID=A0ABV4NPQ3_9GAMM|nr:hypothetical protein [uncultured Microbulbifer sp.]
MWKQGILAASVAATVLCTGPLMAQEMPEDLDVTLTVVEEDQDALDVVNNIELPPDLQEIAEETMAAVMEAMASSGMGAEHSEEIEAKMHEAIARHQEIMASARLSAEAAREEAMRTAEVARENIEEAVKSAMNGADIQGVIEQMMQDILSSLPVDIRDQISMELDGILGQVQEDLPDGPDA